MATPLGATGVTYGLPNFVGELFSLTPTETPFLSMIGGLTGGQSTTNTRITWQTETNTTAAIPTIVEGDDTTFVNIARTEVVNVLQIFQYGVELSYTKQAAVGNLGNWTTRVWSASGEQPVQDELAHQLMLKLRRAAYDVELSFVTGTLANPTTNTARGTAGLDTVITTNTVAAGAVDLTGAMIDDALKQMADSGAPFNNVVIMANAFNRQKLSSIYGYAPADRNVGGVAINTIETDFTRLGVVYNRYVPTDTVMIVDVSECSPVFMNIPGKGHFFMEPIAKSGAYDKWQLYGEIGLKYGVEQHHAIITGTTTA